ncbi:MAG: YihY/virulence factor BrkB family protein [Tatlockia sp.]|nr:YihY/virulence factor BrkB family protein [Tatlockia sp.]
MLNNFFTLCKEVIATWSKDRIPSMSAALAYYTLFSLTPILLICIALVGIFFGPEAAQGKIVNEIGSMVGQETGKQIQTMIETANKPVTAYVAQFFGVIMLIFGASGVFSEIQSGLNTIWEVKTNPDWTWFDLLKKRFLSFTIVLGLAFLLLVSLIMGVFFTAVSSYITQFIGLDVFDILFSQLFSFLMEVILFAMMFKILPDVAIKWNEVWLGAIITTLLFTLGKYLLGIYLSHINVSSAFGAAGSVVILLVWMYYTAQIFFIGATITKLISTKNREIVPIRDALHTSRLN